MALYKVTRTDQPRPGEFVEGYVLAPSPVPARGSFYHLPGVTPKNVVARKVDIVVRGRTQILSTYEMEV